MQRRQFWLGFLATLIFLVSVIAPAFAVPKTCCGCCAKEQHTSCACTIDAPSIPIVPHEAVMVAPQVLPMVAILPTVLIGVVAQPLPSVWIAIEHPERGPPGLFVVSLGAPRAPPHA